MAGRILGLAERFGWNTYATIGAGAIGAYVCGKNEDVERTVATAYVKAVRWTGVDPNFTNQKLKKSLYDQQRNVENVIEVSPFFYGAYHLINPRKHPWGRHVGDAFVKSFVGTARQTPFLGGMYVAAAFIIPQIETEFRERGCSEQDASDFAQLATFSLAGPVELGVEMQGVGLSLSQMRFGPAALASGLVTIRLITGVATNALAQSKGSIEDKNRNLATTVVGTSFSQYGVNAAMQAMSKPNGTMMNYVTTGCPEGGGNWKMSALRVGGVVFQRTVFCERWNNAIYTPRPVPAWVNE